ncbi:MAG: hypothetical protein H7X93_12540 [Sphingomonadaceae bacterium]|nr:hypothetical protein [Sphingomonadaceae bacterium]
MGEEKFASLTSGLLARKGGAKPAMRRQGFVNPMGDLHDLHDDLGWNDMGYHAPQPAEPADANGVVVEGFPPPPVVRIQQEELARDFAPQQEGDAEASAEPCADELQADPVVEDLAEEPPISFDEDIVVPLARPDRPRKPMALDSVTADPVQAPLRAREKAAFTLRLDPDRHLRLRLASAMTGRSSQRIVTEALDRFLEAIPELDGIAERLPRGSASIN